MSIVTKTGDSGKTSLYTGERISKDDIRVEAFGTVDELDSHLGLIKHYIDDRELIENIQMLLKRVMAELASVQIKYHNPINLDDIDYINEQIKKYEKDIKLDGLVVPGKTKKSAKIDICRTVTRRAERRIVSIEGVSECILIFINRLSDLLFLLALTP